MAKRQPSKQQQKAAGERVQALRDGKALAADDDSLLPEVGEKEGRKKKGRKKKNADPSAAGGKGKHRPEVPATLETALDTLRDLQRLFRAAEESRAAKLSIAQEMKGKVERAYEAFKAAIEQGVPAGEVNAMIAVFEDSRRLWQEYTEAKAHQTEEAAQANEEFTAARNAFVEAMANANQLRLPHV